MLSVEEKYHYLNTWIALKTKIWLSKILPGHKNYTKFMILCSPRTGSTLLHTYLNSHRHIMSLGEILRRNSSVRLNAESKIFSAYGSNIKAVGLKFFYDYMHDETYRTAFNYLKADKSIKIIHLVRKDHEAQYLSYNKAVNTGFWNSHKKPTENGLLKKTKVIIDKKEFENLVETSRRGALSVFQHHEIFNITYEDLVENDHSTLVEIQNFLGVKNRRLSTLLKKIG